MHRTGPRFLVLALILIAVPSFSTSATAKPSAGAALFEAKCSTCHQANGAGNPQMKAPVIAGFDRAYVRHQLTQFRTGRRGVEPMAQAMVAAVASLSEQQMDQLAAHVASLPPVSVQRSLKPTGFRGRGLYSGCSSCHGPSGEGNAALGAPRIAGQYTWYLRAQLVAFRNGRRGDDPKDTRGQQMRAMAVAIASEADIDVLVQYIGGLGR